MKRNIWIIVTILMLAAFALSACGGAEEAPLQVASDATWPPFEIIDEETKEIVGFDIDLMNAVAERAGLNIEIVNVGFDPLLAGIAECQYDMAISAITITEERSQSMAFSDPYFAAGQMITVAIDNSDILGVDDLAGKTVGAQIGTTGAIEVESIEGATLKTYDDVGLAFQDLLNGQIDAVVADNTLAIGYINQNSDALKAAGDTFTAEEYGIAVCIDNPELLAQVNTALNELIAEGFIEEISLIWFSE